MERGAENRLCGVWRMTCLGALDLAFEINAQDSKTMRLNKLKLVYLGNPFLNHRDNVNRVVTIYPWGLKEQHLYHVTSTNY